MITSFTAYGLAGSGHPHPLIALAQRRGSTATTRAGAYRYLMANISEPELAEKLAHRFARPIGGRGREAALKAIYDRHGAAACTRFGLPVRDQLDQEIIEGIELPKKVARRVRRDAEERYAYPIVVTRSDMPPRMEGSGHGFRWGGKWKTARGSYQASTRQIRVGYEWIMRVPELATVMIAARLGVEVK